MKRDYIQEIKSIKSRLEYNSRLEYYSRLEEIEYALTDHIEHKEHFNTELLKYIPISTVACFEAFFRSTIKELIDFGKPYIDNVAKFNQAKNVKFDFEIVSAIQAKSLTVGEFIAHILPYNNYEDFSSNLSILIDKDFTDELKKFNRVSVHDHINVQSEDFRNRFVEIIQSVKKTYELRHIFCHEFANTLNINEEEIIRDFENCKLFLEQTNNYIAELLYPNYPETQMDINIEAGEKFEIKNAELEKLIETIKQLIKKDEFDTERFNESNFDECIEQWKHYRKLHAEYKASRYRKGSIFPMIYSSDMEFVTEEKIKSLKTEFEEMLRKSNYS